MSDRTAIVYADLDNQPILVGTLHARFRKNREHTSFNYDSLWAHPNDEFDQSAWDLRKI